MTDTEIQETGITGITGITGKREQKDVPFPLAVSGKYVNGGKTELVMTGEQLIDAVLKAVERSPIGVAIVGPATGHKDEPA